MPSIPLQKDCIIIGKIEECFIDDEQLQRANGLKLKKNLNFSFGVCALYRWRLSLTQIIGTDNPNCQLK